MQRTFIIFVVFVASSISAFPAAKAMPPIIPRTEPPICAAIIKNDAAAVDEILKNDPTQAQTAEFNGEPILRVAVEQGNAAIVSALLKAGANPNEVWNGQTALLSVSPYSLKKDIMKVLLENGAKAEGTDREDYTLLTRCVSQNKIDLVQVLLDAGANVNEQDGRGRIALSLAVDNTSMLQLLLEKKADITWADARGDGILHRVASRVNPDSVRLLIESGAPLNRPNLGGYTPLHFAAGSPSDTIDVFIRAGADVNVKNLCGDAPLHIALRTVDPNNYPPSEQPGDRLALLAEKTDPTLRDGLGFTPLLLAIVTRQQTVRDIMAMRAAPQDTVSRLFYAVSQDDVAAVIRLIKKQPYLVTQRLPNGMTPLHVAALWGSLDTTKTLLDKGAAIDERDAAGRTPLYLATAGGDGDFAKRRNAMVSLLLEKGAGTNSADRNASVPLIRAIRASDTALASILLAHGARIAACNDGGSGALLSALSNSKSPKEKVLEMLTLLLDNGADPNAGNMGSFPLPLAARRDDKQLVSLLLERGADPNRHGMGEPSALSLAALWNKNIDIASLLIDKGADMYEDTSRYNFNISSSYLMLAIEESNKTLARLLIDKKVNVNGRGCNDNNDAPLLAAVRGRQWEIAGMLINAGANVNCKLENGAGLLTYMLQGNPRDNGIIDLMRAKGAKEDEKPAALLPVGLATVDQGPVTTIAPGTSPLNSIIAVK